jgi:DNA replication initiation complex subunit (GINS family)
MMDNELAKTLTVENADGSKAIPLPKGGSFSKHDDRKEKELQEIMGENDTGKDSTVGGPAKVGDAGKSATGNDEVGEKDAIVGQ